MTTPKAIFGGLALVALAIASIPYSTDIMKPKLQKVVICDPKYPNTCATLRRLDSGSRSPIGLYTKSLMEEQVRVCSGNGWDCAKFDRAGRLQINDDRIISEIKESNDHLSALAYR